MSMKKNSFKRQLAVVVCMLLCGLSIQAADDGLITDQIVINKLEAGTLPQRISSDEKNLITNLKINGEINGTDLRFIREMAGQSADGYKTKGNLSVLDLSDVKIVSGGDYYYSQRAGILETYYTKDDEIGFCAFSNCSGLTRLFLPSTITSIGHFAFWGCSGLASLSLPPNLASIGYEVFRYCSGLTSVTLPSSLTSIDPCAFANCSGLTSLTLPYKLTSIGEEAFCGCSSLTNLALSPSLTRIGEGAFNGCFNLSTLTIPSSLTSISKLNNKLSETPLFTSAFVTVYVAWQTPIPAGDFFCNFELWGCKLYVPKGTKQVYLQSEVWKDFGNIQEYDVTDITKVDNNSETKEVSWYSLDGQRLASPTKGINIVRYSDGSIKKEIVE